MSETTPATTPKMTKTEAKELKSLVKHDFGVLKTGLQNRRQDLERAAYWQQQQIRESDAAVFDKVMAPIAKRIESLNEAIDKAVAELNEKGFHTQNWTYNGKGKRVLRKDPLVAKTFRKSVPELPHGAVRDEDGVQEIVEEIRCQFNEAYRQLEEQEYGYIKALTLQTLESEAAIDFLTDLPSPETLMATPTALEAVDIKAITACD